MFNPFGALTATAGSFAKNYADDQTKAYDLMGMQALGKAFQFQPQSGPIPGIPGIGPQGPQAPPPGQASMPAQPAGPPPGPQAAAAGPPQSFSGGGGGPGLPYGGFQPGGNAPSTAIEDALARLRQGQGQPMGGYNPQNAPQPQAPPQMAQGAMQPQGPQGPPQMPPGAQARAPEQPPQQPQVSPQGLPQFDLQTLVQRIQKANPNLPPQAMVAALTRAVPLLNLEGKQQLAMVRQEMLAGNLDIKRSMLDLARERADRQGDKEGEKKSEVQKIGDAIIAGDQPPTLTGLYRDRAAIQAYLADKKYSLSKAQQEWNVAQKQIGSLNSQRMIQFAGTAKSVVNTLDEVKSLSEEMEQSGIPLLNKAQLTALNQTQGNTPAGQLAGRYIAAVNTLKSEFANLENGGYAPTEEVWKLANKQIDENFGVKQLGSRLDEIRRLIGFRIQAIPNLEQLGGASANRYTGQPGQSLVPPAPGGGGGAQQGGTSTPSAIGPNGHRIVVRGGKWVDEQTGQPVQ